MKKGEKKVIKNKNEVVVAEKVIDTRPKQKSSVLQTDPLIIEISKAIFSLEERQSEIIELLNKVSDRMGMSKI